MRFLKYYYKNETTEQLESHIDNFKALKKSSKCRFERSNYKAAIALVRKMLSERE